ncbi:MAG: hypothetical protein ACK4N5_27620 [Myxococcales bacterium]
MIRLTCYACGLDQDFQVLGRRDTCEKCGVDLRCCRQCRHFDENTHHGCKEPAAEVPREKTQGNFCEFFSASRGGKAEDETAKAKAAWDALFSKK